MNSDELAQAFDKLVEAVRASDDSYRCWQAVLDITGERDNKELASLDIEAELQSIVSQTRNILDSEPLTSESLVLWFGLFDGLRGAKQYAGYYIAGYTSEEHLDEGEAPVYFPESRYISSRLLDAIKSEANRVGGESPRFGVFDYAIMFGGAAMLSRFVALRLGIRLPIYVGFDSGDFARIAN